MSYIWGKCSLILLCLFTSFLYSHFGALTNQMYTILISWFSFLFFPIFHLFLSYLLEFLQLLFQHNYWMFNSSSIFPIFLFSDGSLFLASRSYSVDAVYAPVSDSMIPSLWSFMFLALFPGFCSFWFFCFGLHVSLKLSSNVYWSWLSVYQDYKRLEAMYKWAGLVDSGFHCKK